MRSLSPPVCRSHSRTHLKSILNRVERRTVGILEQTGGPYAVVVGHAVRAWVDMISLGMIDASWLDRLPPAFRTRLADLLADPNG